MTVGEYRYRKSINDRDGNTIGCKETSVPNDIVMQIKADAIDECIQIVQKIKDDYNDAKFGEQIPINYGTICGIIISLEHLKEQSK